MKVSVKRQNQFFISIFKLIFKFRFVNRSLKSTVTDLSLFDIRIWILIKLDCLYYFTVLEIDVPLRLLCTFRGVSRASDVARPV